MQLAANGKETNKIMKITIGSNILDNEVKFKLPLESKVKNKFLTFVPSKVILEKIVINKNQTEKIVTIDATNQLTAGTGNLPVFTFALIAIPSKQKNRQVISP
jgi:hypothetical protein